MSKSKISHSKLGTSLGLYGISAWLEIVSQILLKKKKKVFVYLALLTILMAFFVAIVFSFYGVMGLNCLALKRF